MYKNQEMRLENRSLGNGSYTSAARSELQDHLQLWEVDPYDRERL